MTNNKASVLIVAAGTGERFGGAVPKQYLPLLGKPVLRWSIEAFLQHPRISELRVVIHPDHAFLYKQAVEGLHLPDPIIGGSSRQHSVRLGLEALSSPDHVLIHDAARPCLTLDLITRICAALETHLAVVPGLAIHDTVKRTVGGILKTESRDGLWAVQTPQGFHYGTILDLHRNSNVSVTDDAGLAETAGIPVCIVDGERSNIKITQSEDLHRAEQNISLRHADIRTGKGYDVHRLVPKADSRALKLCGIEVPHTKVLEGHSDADVALHALTDALLATICDGDIGVHFSPKDMRWKNADSTQFLKHACHLVGAQGGIISHVDLTIICEMPKIGPHRDHMRAKVASILNLPVSRVSIKATTTEGLGFTGRGEGIAAEAIATVRLPFAQNVEAKELSDMRKWGT